MYNFEIMDLFPHILLRISYESNEIEKQEIYYSCLLVHEMMLNACQKQTQKGFSYT